MTLLRPTSSTGSTSASTTKPSALDTSPTKAWADALAQATVNSPQKSVRAAPGDTITSIAESHHDTVAGVEEANPRIFCTNLIPVGQKIYLPKTTPAQIVTGVDDSQIKPIITAMANANAADQGLQDIRNPGLHAEAQKQAAQSWDTVEQTTLDMLMNNNAGAYPEQAAGAEVRQLNALEPGNTKFAGANNAALAQATQNWAQMGVTKPQLGPIIEAYNNAQHIAQDLENLRTNHNPAIVARLNAAERQANQALNAAIEKSLTDAANQAGGDPQVRSKAITQRAMNIQLAGPQAQAFQTAVDNANYNLQVTKPAQAVANAYAKGGAQAAAQALKTATQNVGNSYYAGQIIRASQGTIDRITQDMGSLASSASRPNRTSLFVPSPEPETFEQIYADLSQSVEAANTIKVSSSGKQVFDSPGGVAAANLVANSIAQNAPKNPASYQSLPYSAAAETAISNGDGATLAMATAAALQRQGNPVLATYLVEGAASGIQDLQSKTDSDVRAFATTTASLHDLRATWGPFMTHSQLVKATNGYLHDHPNVRQQSDAQLGTISQDGDSIGEAEAAWTSYRAKLDGIEGRPDLAAAAKSLTGTDSSTAFAVSQSPNVNNAIVTAIGPSAPVSHSAGSVVQALAASPAWNLPRSTRSFFNALFKRIDAKATAKAKAAADEKEAAAKAAEGNENPPPNESPPSNENPPSNPSSPSSESVYKPLFTTLSAAGFLLTLENTIARRGFPLSSSQEAATSVYSALGFVKYGGEIAAVLAQNNIARTFALRVGLSETRLNNLAKLSKNPLFKAIGSTYYGVGALANVLQAFDDIHNGDDVDAGFDVALAFANLANASKPLFEEMVTPAFAEGVGAAGSGFGLGVVALQLIYEGVKSAEATVAYQHDSSEFLQRGLGLSPAVAEAFSAPADQSNGSSASAALQDYAHTYHMTPEQLLKQLNAEPIDKVEQFIDEAANMPRQSNGQYAKSLSTDSPKDVGTHWVREQPYKGLSFQTQLPNQADSLRQLKYWADYLFGQNKIG